MAIDTAEKRRSVSGVGVQPYAAPGVTPNAAKDSQWRAQSAWSYSGSAPTPPGDVANAEQTISCGSLPSAGLDLQHTTLGGTIGMEG